MELLIVLLLVLGLAFTVVMAVVLGGGAASKKRAMAGKDDILEELFDGEPETVTYRERFGDLPADLVIAEAHRRGYRVLTDTRPTNNSRELLFGR